MQTEIIVVGGVIVLLIGFLAFSHRFHSRQRTKVQELCAKEFPNISYKKPELDSGSDSGVEAYLKKENFQANPELRVALRKLRVMRFGRVLTLITIILLIIILVLRYARAF
jgi:hypothetical protein